MRRNFVALAAFGLLSAPALAKAPAPEVAAPCNQAVVVGMLGPSLKAADLLLACANVPGQSAYMIARSRAQRYDMLLLLDKPALAEPELVALTSPPLAKQPVFTNVPSGALVIGNQRSIGTTQVDLLSALANFRLNAKDFTAARSLADRAIAAAGHDPDLVLDVAPAHAVRAKLAYLEQQPEPTLKFAIRAWLRGSTDSWIDGLIKAQSTEAQAALDALRKRLKEGVSGYSFAVSPQGQLSQKLDDLKRVIAEGKAAVAELEAFEAKELGPL